VHGGMGFIEETGAAQHLRDARITTIYEGTTGIQANDFIGRKTARDGGQVARAVCGEIADVAGKLSTHANADLHDIGRALSGALVDLESALDWMVRNFATKPREAHAGAVPYLKLWGVVTGGWQMGRAALASSAHLASREGDAAFHRAKIATARFYADCLLPQASAHARAVTRGGDAVLALASEQF